MNDKLNINTLTGGVMQGKYLKDRSWEKQSFYKLDNGFIVRIEFNQFYGDMVAAVLEDDEIIWHCSDSHKTAPLWIRNWTRVIHKKSNTKSIKPLFERIYS